MTYSQRNHFHKISPYMPYAEDKNMNVAGLLAVRKRVIAAIKDVRHGFGQGVRTSRDLIRFEAELESLERRIEALDPQWRAQA